jgi:bifunctional non-homologous end joining protein LigD
LCTYDDSRALAGLIAQLIEAERPDIATTARQIDRREGKVYIDWLQNRHGQLLVSPYSARPLPGAPVSMPLRWDEVTRSLDIGKFTIANAVRRMTRLGTDPLRPVLDDVPDLLAALERLSARLAGRT